MAYNGGVNQDWALNTSRMSVAVNNSVNFTTLNWCPTCGVCNNYNLLIDSYFMNRSDEASSGPMCFCTADLLDASLLGAINQIAYSKSAGPFATLLDGMNWVRTNGIFVTNQNYPSIVTSGNTLNLDAGLPASYPMVGTNWYDLTSNNNNNGTLVNGVTYSSTLKGVLTINGSNQYVSFTTPTNIPISNSNYTISVWFSANSIGDKGLVGWGNYGTTNQVNAFRLTSSGLKNYWWGNDLVSTTTITTGLWYNAVATFDGTTRSIWVNGILISSDTPTGHNVPNANNLTIGVTNTSEYFDGSIGEVQIFDRGLSSDEITSNFNELLTRYNGSNTEICVTPTYCSPPIIPGADYVVFKYDFAMTSGADLDTLTTLYVNGNTTPYTNNTNPVGYCINGGLSSGVWVGPNLWWGGDNTGFGTESVYVDIATLSLSGVVTSVQINCRANWYSAVGDGMIGLQMFAYSGGTMVSDGNFGFNNVGGVLLGNYDFPDVDISLFNNTCTDTQCVGLYGYNLLTGVFTVQPCITPSTPTPTPTSTPTQTPTPTPTPTSTLQDNCVLNFGASMVPCIGGTVDDHMEGYIVLNNQVTVDTEFAIIANFISGTPSGNCNNPTQQQYLYVTVPAGENQGLLTCPQAPFINSNGATICSVELYDSPIPLCNIPTPTPTNTKTPTVTPTPTTPLNPDLCTSWDITNNSVADIEWSGLVCLTSISTGGTISPSNTITTVCIVDGTLEHTGSALVTINAVC